MLLGGWLTHETYTQPLGTPAAVEALSATAQHLPQAFQPKLHEHTLALYDTAPHASITATNQRPAITNTNADTQATA